MCQLVLPWQRFKVRGIKNDFRNEINRLHLVTLPIFAMFTPQSIEIQPFKVECLSTKTLKFQQYDFGRQYRFRNCI